MTCVNEEDGKGFQMQGGKGSDVTKKRHAQQAADTR